MSNIGLLPVPPNGGGYLILNSAQLSNLDLLCKIKTHYPRTTIIAQKPIPMRGQL
jgi:hypothetical protein